MCALSAELKLSGFQSQLPLPAGRDQCIHVTTIVFAILQKKTLAGTHFVNLQPTMSSIGRAFNAFQKGKHSRYIETNQALAKFY